MRPTSHEQAFFRLPLKTKIKWNKKIVSTEWRSAAAFDAVNYVLHPNDKAIKKKIWMLKKTTEWHANVWIEECFPNIYWNFFSSFSHSSFSSIFAHLLSCHALRVNGRRKGKEDKNKIKKTSVDRRDPISSCKEKIERKKIAEKTDERKMCATVTVTATRVKRRKIRDEKREGKKFRFVAEAFNLA